MKKRLVFQVCVGKPSTLYKHCINSAAVYCEQYGIDHIVLTEPILRIQPDPFNSGRSKEASGRLGYLPIFEKENAFDYFDRYDQIAIIDADIWIRPGAPNIFDDLRDDVDFAGVVEADMPITPQYERKIVAYSRGQYGHFPNYPAAQQGGYRFYNMGMMVMNKSITKHIKGDARSFLNQPRFKDFVDGKGLHKWSTDQTLLNYWLWKDRVATDTISWKWNGLYRGIRDDKVKECNFVHFFLKDHLPDAGENVDSLMKVVW
jgi:hypothetical protein